MGHKECLEKVNSLVTWLTNIGVFWNQLGTIKNTGSWVPPPAIIIYFFWGASLALMFIQAPLVILMYSKVWEPLLLLVKELLTKEETSSLPGGPYASGLHFYYF